VQRLLGLLVLGMVCTIGLSTTGCKKKEEPAKGADGKGAGGDGKGGNGDMVAVIEYDVFPTEVIVLKQGEKKDVEISRKGKTLKSVTVEAKSSDLKVHVKGVEFKDDAKTATVSIHADEKAPPGKHTITLTAGDVKKTIDVEVQKAAGEPEPKGKGKVEPEPKGKGKVEPEPKGKGKEKDGALNFRQQRDAYAALGREELSAEAQVVSRRQTVWFTREF